MPVQEPPIEHTRLKSPRNRTMPVKYRDYDMDVEGLVVNKSGLSNSASKHARDLVLVSSPRFWGMRNHLEPFPEASD